MKASELRIGNYLQFKKSLIDVYGLHEEKVYNHIVEHNYFDNETEDIKPIPLTEEWLLKFGFKKEEYQDDLLDTFMYNKDSITRVEFSNKHKLLYWHDNYTSIYHQELKHVHQLQNLYFALTGEELKTK